MTPETTLQLGDFVFAELEIPASLPFGGEQALVVHRLVGGTKVVDAMGASPRAVSWSGMFLGQTAADRARYLDTLRVQGLPLDLTWSSFKYQVVVRSFEADFHRGYEIPYSITCEVVKDSTTPVTTLAASDVDRAITEDSSAASDLSDDIGDDTLTTLMGGVTTSVGSVTSFAGASPSVIAGVLQPIAAAQARVATLVDSNSDVLASASAFGAVTPGASAMVNASALLAQVDASTVLANLHNLDFTLGRMTRNLQQVNASPRVVATAGGNLFRIAQQQYGDANAWATIATANGLTDPFVSGTAVLTIPPQPGAADGVLAA